VIVQSGPHSLHAKGRPGLLDQGRHIFWSWWLWSGIALVAVYTDHWNAAVLTAVAALVTYLVAPHEHSPTYGLEARFQVASEEFLYSTVGTTGVPFLPGNNVTLLNNGDEFYPAMLDAIQRATHSVTIEAYIYWAGDIGMQFAQALAERAAAGAKVKILLDAVGSSTIGKEILNTLQSGGCQIAWYNPARWGTVGRYNHRTHRKSLIIDGRVAFTGGAGIADHWSGHAQDPAHWRDIEICVDGPGAVPLQTGFAQNWLNTTGELVSGPDFFPTIDPSGDIATQTILSSPEIGSSAVRIVTYLAIVCAQERLYIANAYFLPDDAAIDILIDAKQRGVDVKIIVPGGHNDMWIARHGSIHLYGKLLKADIEIYEYQRTMLHQKIMVVDGVWLTVGTTNFDNRSFALNEESNVCIYDRDFAQELERVFISDLAECRRVRLEEWKSRGLKTRAQGLLAAFLKEQI
jgi:cardiolipin synthase A/B